MEVRPVLIPLTHGYATLIDADDEARVTAHHWYAKVDGDRVIAVTKIHGQKVYLHCFLIGASRECHIDHRNRDTLDNRKGNLRPATHSQNMANRRSWSRTGFKGVHRTACGWRAQITKHGRKTHLGVFSSPDAAARAYDEAARRTHGEFACLNFP